MTRGIELHYRNSSRKFIASMQSKILAVGAGGFIGGHLVAELLRKGHKDIRAADIKPFGEWHQKFPQVENLQLNLQLKDAFVARLFRQNSRANTKLKYGAMPSNAQLHVY